MCGIGLNNLWRCHRFIIYLCRRHISEVSPRELVFSVDDLKATLRRRGPDSLGCKKSCFLLVPRCSLEDSILFLQPLQDSSKNILVYNGEIFGGIHVESDSNDAEVLMRTLEQCCSCNSNREATCLCKGSGRCSVVDVLSAVKGPWALIYWQDSSRTLWFGRDAFGRRSLLVHWPTVEDPQLLLSSVSPSYSVEQISGI
ncbi:hypothetical protein Patl1_16689 [Pistacia atlantica]|uniref:Uncharacterized protein n=1 Tax=Pistacia atlantica TaxID=434234 RepID=A0ACC1BB60_9ROSI|nr:hypothetical protein Patl1_16689 [Pistacia atlantica]